MSQPCKLSLKGFVVDKHLAIMVVMFLAFRQLSWSFHGHFGMLAATGSFVLNPWFVTFL